MHIIFPKFPFLKNPIVMYYIQCPEKHVKMLTRIKSISAFFLSSTNSALAMIYGWALFRFFLNDCSFSSCSSVARVLQFDLILGKNIWLFTYLPMWCYQVMIYTQWNFQNPKTKSKYFCNLLLDPSLKFSFIPMHFCFFFLVACGFWLG